MKQYWTLLKKLEHKSPLGFIYMNKISPVLYETFYLQNKSQKFSSTEVF